MFAGTIDEKAQQAEKLLSSIAPDALCVAQDWDQRIDCLISLPDGSIVGEMIALEMLSEVRIRETGERLRQLAAGFPVQLVNELKPPRRIS